MIGAAERVLVLESVVGGTGDVEAGFTFGDVDGEGALGDLLPGEGDVDGVGSLHHGSVGAAESAVALVFQNNLHRVPLTLRVYDDNAHVPCPGTWETHTQGGFRYLPAPKVGFEPPASHKKDLYYTHNRVMVTKEMQGTRLWFLRKNQKISQS